MTLKSMLLAVLPAPVVTAVRRRRHERVRRAFRGLSTPQVFDKIYADGLWGDGDVNSGPGSRVAEIVAPYVSVVRQFLASFPAPVDVVDLGCGDFFVGSKLRDCCKSYIACDVVPSVIARNRARYPGTEFRVLDITTDEVPAADVVMLRQVLQHLSNAEIARVVPQLERKFKYLVLTEHLPAAERFQPNIDKPTGVDIRPQANGSGVVLTSPPFNLQVIEERRLCEAPYTDGRIVTTLYRFGR
jgi:hypothetical protein